MASSRSMYGPIWERIKEQKVAMLKFPDDELNIALAIRRTRKAVIKLKDADIGYKATSAMSYRLVIEVDVKARTLKFQLVPCIRKALSCQL